PAAPPGPAGPAGPAPPTAPGGPGGPGGPLPLVSSQYRVPSLHGSIVCPTVVNATLMTPLMSAPAPPTTVTGFTEPSTFKMTTARKVTRLAFGRTIVTGRALASTTTT